MSDDQPRLLPTRDRDVGLEGAAGDLPLVEGVQGAGARGLRELAPRRLVGEELTQGGGQRRGVPRGDQAQLVSVPPDLTATADVREDHRGPAGGSLHRRAGEPFAVGGQAEDVERVVERRHVAPLAEQLDVVAHGRQRVGLVDVRRSGPDEPGLSARSARAAVANSPMPFSATSRPTPPTSSSSSPTPSSCRTAARCAGSGTKRARSVPLPTTSDRPRGVQRCERPGVVGVLEQLGVGEPGRHGLGAAGPGCRLSAAVGLADPQPVAGVDDDGHAHEPAEHPAQHAGLGVVGVQHVGPQPAQQPAPARRQPAGPDAGRQALVRPWTGRAGRRAPRPARRTARARRCPPCRRPALDVDGELGRPAAARGSCRRWSGAPPAAGRPPGSAQQGGGTGDAGGLSHGHPPAWPSVTDGAVGPLLPEVALDLGPEELDRVGAADRHAAQRHRVGGRAGWRRRCRWRPTGTGPERAVHRRGRARPRCRRSAAGRRRSRARSASVQRSSSSASRRSGRTWVWVWLPTVHSPLSTISRSCGQVRPGPPASRAVEPSQCIVPPTKPVVRYSVKGTRPARSSGHAWWKTSSNPSSKVSTTDGRASPAATASRASSSESTRWSARTSSCWANAVVARSRSSGDPPPTR